jgi:hypothetical protein
VVLIGLLAIVLGAIAIWRWEGLANINRGWLPDAELFRSRRFWRCVYVATGSGMILFGVVAVVIGVAQSR